MLKRVWPSTLVFGAILALSVILPLPRTGKILGLSSPCSMYNIFGIPCPACGLTRAFVCCGHGHFGEAFIWHPLGPALFLGILGFSLWSLWMALAKPPFKVSDRVQFGSLGALFVVMIVFWGLRLEGTFPLPTSNPFTAKPATSQHHTLR